MKKENLDNKKFRKRKLCLLYMSNKTKLFYYSLNFEYKLLGFRLDPYQLFQMTQFILQDL